MTDEQKNTLYKAFLKEFEKARLIKRSGKRFELTHDSLGTKVAEKRNANEIAYIEAVRLLKSKFRLSLKAETKDYFTERHLLYLQPFVEGKKIKTEFSEMDWQSCRALIGESEQIIEQEKEKEKTRLEAEKQQLIERQQLLEKNQRSQKRFIYFLMTAGIILTSLTIYAFILQNKILHSQLLAADGLKVQGNYEGAITVLQELDRAFSTRSLRKEIQHKRDTFIQIKNWMAIADSSLTTKNYHLSLLYIDSSRQLSPDGFINKTYATIKDDRDKTIGNLVKDIDRLIEQSKISTPAILDAKTKYCRIKYFDPEYDGQEAKKKEINVILTSKGMSDKLITDCQ